MNCIVAQYICRDKVVRIYTYSIDKRIREAINFRFIFVKCIKNLCETNVYSDKYIVIKKIKHSIIQLCY